MFPVSPRLEMASRAKPSSLGLEEHLENVKSREKACNKLQGWPSYGNFLENKESMIAKLVTDLDESVSLEQFYEKLKKATQTLGNQLQEVYCRKSTSKFFAANLGKSAALPVPDAALHYFIRITFENVMRAYGERVADALGQKKAKNFPLILLDAYLHELRNLEQETVELPAKAALLQYLDQWGSNVWPPAMRASDIVPRSWTTCVAKMQQIFALEWKPAPIVTVIEENGDVRQEQDDSKSLTSFVAFRSFFLALFLYCSIHPQFFAANFEALASKTKELVFGDFLVEWVQKRADQLQKKPEQQDSASDAISGVDE